MDNPDKLATFGTQDTDEGKQSKNTTQKTKKMSNTNLTKTQQSDPWYWGRPNNVCFLRDTRPVNHVVKSCKSLVGDRGKRKIYVKGRNGHSVRDYGRKNVIFTIMSPYGFLFFLDHISHNIKIVLIGIYSSVAKNRKSNHRCMNCNVAIMICLIHLELPFLDYMYLSVFSKCVSY